MASPKGLPGPGFPKGFNKDDFIFSKLFKCVNLIGQNVMCDVVRAMYSHTSIKSDGGTKTLYQYLQDIGWSKRTIKDKITKLHKELLDKDLNEVDFDISFAFVIITEVCKDLANQLSDAAKKAVEDLKKMRNKICHKYGIACDELIPMTDNLKQLLKDIYEGVGVVVDKDFSDNTKCMEDNIQSIVSAEFYQMDLDTYLEDVKKFREDLKFHMIHEGNEEFQSSYSRLRILNPCIWMTEEEVEKTPLSKYEVDTIFTPLKIESTRRNIEIADIFTVKKRIRGADQEPSALLMYGLAGCGKTSLCHYVIHGWCKKDENIVGLDHFDLIIFVEVRRARSKSLIEFLKEECMAKTCQKFDSGDIIPTLKDLDILVVVDGFDEAKKGKSLDLVKDIFCKFCDQRILLTTRPEYKEDAFYIAKTFDVSYLPIQICGFDEQGLKIFSEKVFGAVERDERRRQKELRDFLHYMETTGKVLDEHLKLPLTLSLLIYLWREDSSIVFRITSATMLYLEIFRLCQKRLSNRLEKKGRRDLEEELDKIFFCLGHQAWSLLLEGDLLCLTKMEFKHVKEECQKRSVDVLDFLSTYLYCETEENEDMSEKVFAFLHKTQMEYLAGAYLANSLTFASYRKLSFANINAEVEGKSEWQSLLEVIKYLTGSLAITDNLTAGRISEIFGILEKPSSILYGDFNFWWSFYLETLKNKIAGNEIIDRLPHLDWTLKEKQVISGLKFYHVLNVNLNSLVIDIPIDVDPYDIKELLPILRDIRRKKLGQRRANMPIVPVLTELHFWNHDNYSKSKLSDEFIMTLNPWGHLTNFTGSLGEREVLSYCFKLKVIRVRLNTIDAVRAFKQSLSRIYKSVNTLRMTLGIPFSCQPSDLCDLQFKDTFELTLKGTKDEHKDWIVGVVKQINGRNGCLKLSLLNSEVTYETITYLLEKLRNDIHEKITLDTINKPPEKQVEVLKKLSIKVNTEINWM
ncbi:uncharacterized protein LOC135225592 isoform X2 [Macrobrachium nipponense]|uniref:uncharacterized protein LOC135225592 isoform X2 n=1 Tax=Macrobrachium nipponense TaxID=159736 RepID=UPI0030C87B74